MDVADLFREREEDRKDYSLRLAIWAVFLVGWQLASKGVSSSYIPSPLDVFHALTSVIASKGFLGTIGHTAARVALGIILVLIFGNTILWLARRTKTGKLLKDELLFPLTYTMPTIIWILIVSVVAGLSFFSPVIVIAIAVTPFYIINMEEGLKELDEKRMEVGKVFSTDPYARFRHVTLPLLYPHLISAFRLTFGLSWRMIVLVEIFTATTGVGTQIQLAQQMYSVEIIAAWGVIIVSIVSVVDKSLMLLDRYLLRRHAY